MASSSSLKKRLSLVGQVGILGEVEEEEEEEEERRDWLQLGLGLGFGLNTSGKKKQEHYQSKENPVSVSPTVLPSPSPTLPGVQHHQDIGLGLGLELGLGFDNGSMCYKDVAPISNNNQKKLWEDLDQGGQYCDDEDRDLDYDDEDIPSGSCLDWQNPKFNDSHHISTRRRPHPGLWFTLISFTNRVGQALPQIPKAYIRVKDENMTVFTVKKYLVRKLGLSNEAEIDILCMGQNLLQTQTLKQVRDAVWLPGLIQSINSTALVFATSQGRPINHLMQLHYGRRCLV